MKSNLFVENDHLSNIKFYYEKEKADNGDANSQIIVGQCYENGDGIEKSFEKAVYYYQLASDQNNPIGLFLLGDCYNEGKGLEKSLQKALYYYQLSANQKYDLAQFYLAKYFLENKIKEDQAIHYLLSLINQKSTNTDLRSISAYKLGECFEIGNGIKKSIQTAIKYYKIAANKNSPSALERLGDLYKQGIGVKKDLIQAFNYYEKALNVSDIKSLIRQKIGECYEKGIGTKKNFEKAFTCYQKSCEEALEIGFQEPIYKLAECYEIGIGTLISLEKAIYYYTLAAENGLKVGYYKAGCCCQQIAKPEFDEKAIFYFKRGATQDDALSQYMLAKAFELGKGIEQSLEMAFKYYNLAAKNGCNEAFYNISKCYCEGLGVQQSDKEAIKFYNIANSKIDSGYIKQIIIAADNGDSEAQYQVGRYYKDGIGLEQSNDKALKYFKLAADQKNSKAYKEVYLLYHYANKEIEALKYLKLAASIEDAPMQFVLGMTYYLGDIMPKSDEESLKYFFLSAKKGFEPALSELKKYKPCTPFFYPDTKKIEIDIYNNDIANYENLEKIFKKEENADIYVVAEKNLDLELISIIRNALLNSPKFIFISLEDNIKNLVFSLKEIGYYNLDNYFRIEKYKNNYFGVRLIANLDLLKQINSYLNI